MTRSFIARALALGLSLTVGGAVAAETTGRPEALRADGVPELPQALVDATAPYLQSRSATFMGWSAADRSMLVRTRFGNTEQMHAVAAPGAARTQLSFES
ncbi:MAG TPA: S9 family peptidase, partial [Xanthomonadaceae bacterium]|nr:S9 family peptidase [Xanthomonadaceae bacterium]